ncbi:MAG TPA: hypothetical protein VM532_17220 [Burkholderiales bacterium]|nr:hypothetical protein [Burkholderiales bacterium]
MLTLSKRNQVAIGLMLAALMAATRGGHHIASLAHLPSASWAVFFLAGVYLRSGWTFPAFMIGAVALDAIAIGWMNVSSYCVTPAYAMLLPAYGSLWLAGRWYAKRHTDTLATFGALITAVLVGVTTCELLSSGGFYFFSGRFVEPTLAEFGPRLAKYFPGYLQSMGFWIGVATLIHASLVLTLRRSTPVIQAGAGR